LACWSIISSLPACQEWFGRVCEKIAFAEPCPASYFYLVSTLVEIQDAVTRLHDDEKKALSLWLNSQSDPEMSADEDQGLLRSLDDAIRDADAGKGVPIEDVRKQVRSWAAK
jgi:hypothetical protein